MRLFELPSFLDNLVSREAYVRWLQRKAASHIKRDRKRRNSSTSISDYKRAIHNAVCVSQGKDAYMGEQLDWHLISTYDNTESKQGRWGYKAKFALLPTIDHIGDGSSLPEFKICAWRTNDAKGNLSLEEFAALCERVLAVNS